MTSFRMKLPKILWGPNFASTLNIGYPLDNVTAGSEPRAGSVFDQTVSGIEDAWVTGLDYKLTADVRWIPQTSSTSPLATGWDDGFRSFLEYARQKNVLRFYPDAAGTVFVDCYLVDPMQGFGESESDGSRKVTFTLRVAPFPTPAFYSMTVGSAGWGTDNSYTRTAGAFVCSDGVALDLIGDADITQPSNVYRFLTLTGNATKAIRIRIARSSAYTQQRVSLFDVTAAAYRMTVDINFAAAVPVLTASVGSVLALANRGDGSFDALCSAPGVVAANAQAFTFTPASLLNADMASMYIGNVSVYDSLVGLDSFPGY